MRIVPAAVLLVSLAAACGDPPPGDVREWRPTDHRNAGEAGEDDPARVPTDDRGATPADAIASVWSTQCASCHGGAGRGDGPLSRSFQGVRDLSDPRWQASVTDVDIANTIRDGRNRMPAFRQSLDAATIQALVPHVRSLARQR